MGWRTSAYGPRSMNSWSSLITTEPLQFLPRVTLAHAHTARPATTSTTATTCSARGGATTWCWYDDPHVVRRMIQIVTATTPVVTFHAVAGRSAVRFAKKARASHKTSHAPQQHWITTQDVVCTTRAYRCMQIGSARCVNHGAPGKLRA